MDAHRFDQLARDLGANGPRRGLLGWLLALLLSAPLVSLPREAVEARGRRKRRKKRGKHRQQRRKTGRGRKQRARRKQRKRKQRKRCRPESLAQICAGRCGTVLDTCGQSVDCGSCACEPPCPACQTCDALITTCVTDPAQQGQPCGAAGQICQPNGSCACSPTSCPACQRCDASGLCQPDPVPVGGSCAVCGCVAGAICDGGICQPCDVLHDGDSVASGERLQERLNLGGSVRVCPGRYRHNFVLDPGDEPTLNVEVIGAGDGEDAATSTILDAGGSGRTLLVNEDVIASLQGVRITGGNADLGGGVRNDGRLTLTGCTVSGNVATNLGGGLYHSFNAIGPLTLIDCRVTENRANRGGGIDNNGISTVMLSGCTVSQNRSDQDGGGLYNNSGKFNITGSEISGNRANGDGGGVFNAASVTTSPGEMTFDSTSRIINNTAGADGTGTGGGIFNESNTTTGDSVELNGATVTGNEPNNCAGAPVTGCVEDV